MSDSTEARRAQQASDTPVGSDVHGSGPDLGRLQQAHGELWQWVHRLERYAEAGLQARGLAHDMGNTLTSLMAGTQLALQTYEDGELRRALETNLRLSRDAAERLKTFRRFVSHGAQPESSIPLAEVVDEAISLLAHPIRKAEVELSSDFSSEAAVPGNRLELLQVVGTTLLAVLRGFDGFKGVLELLIEDRKDEVRLVVRRAAITGTAARDDRWWAEGPGLELTVAQRLVASLGGRLDAENGAPQAVLSLPRVASHGRVNGWREAPNAFAPHPRAP